MNDTCRNSEKESRFSKVTQVLEKAESELEQKLGWLISCPASSPSCSGTSVTLWFWVWHEVEAECVGSGETQVWSE